MLQRIRDRISGWIAGVIIALVAGAFMLFGVEYYFDQSTGGQNEAATVNGVVVSENQVNDLFSQLQKQSLAQSHGQPLTDMMTAQLKAYALQSIITQTALFTTLEQDNFRVGMPQIQAMVAQAPEFQEQGKFSESKLMQTLYQMNLSPTQFFQRLQSQWVVNQVTNSIADSAFVLPSEISHWYGLLHQKRAFGYAIVPMQSFVSKTQVTDEEIKKYYDRNPTEFETPAKVSVAYIVLSPTDIEKTVTVTPAEAEQFYQSHLTNYQLPERWVVRQITIPVAANATSAEIQKAEANANAIRSTFQQNKDTGFTSSTLTLSTTEIDPSLRTTLSGLSQGAVSSPLRTPNGFTILKLVETLPAETHSFDSVKNTLMRLLRHQRVNEMLTKMSGQLSDLTYTNPDSLTVAAKAMHLPIQTTAMLTKSGEKTGLFSNPKVLSTVFSDSVFKSDNNSNLIDLPDGSQVVLRVLKKEPSQPLPLASVHGQIKQKLLDKHATAQAGLLAYELQNKLAGSKDPAAIAKQEGLQWHSVALTSSDAKSTTPPEILTAAFKIPASVGVQAIAYQNTHYAVIALEKVENAPTTQASTAENQKLSLQLSTLWGKVLQHCFVDSVLASAHIVVKHPA
ncbi:MAG: hypothetical protein A3F13_05935 [Gammaproteobacteria bacterium RIFCSPHIGHO2_12_FULL_40_19]|nr:MAG: hypothetical protein A3F13_05935 [Gammaproteobacteria bacterium RIFCSPHIGHO2_12_FULL_40_19]